MILIDVHCHLYDERFDKDREEVIKRAEKRGVKAILVAGINKETNRKTLWLSEKYGIIKPALGIYPQENLQTVDEEIEFIKTNKEKIIAISEVGLEFKFAKSEADKNEQVKAFEKFIKLSEQIKKPLIIHSRGAEAKIIEMLESSNAKAVLHCFGGGKSLIKKAEDNGLYFSVPPAIVKSTHFRMLAENVSTSRLLTETDSPWLGPDRERNEPSNVIYSVKEIAKIKGLTEEETANMIFANYQILF